MKGRCGAPAARSLQRVRPFTWKALRRDVAQLIHCYLETRHSPPAVLKRPPAPPSPHHPQPPTGLIDEAGGAKQTKLGVDDALLENNPRNIPRADVARLAVGTIGCEAAYDKAFDCIAVPPAAGAALENDVEALVRTLGGKSCDYSINSQA